LRLYFVRHGESAANLQRVFSNRNAPHALTPRGRDQVAALADKLVGIPFVAAFTSPIPRAQESAAILSDRLGIQFEVSEALREYDVGELEGRSDAASWQRYAALHEAWLRGELDACHPSGESYNAVCRRFTPLLARIRRFDESDAVLLLGHGGTFYCVLSSLCSNLDPNFVFGHGLDHTDVVLTELTDDGLTCVAWGDSRM
jgi:broad specificity phosphatase PhoE